MSEICHISPPVKATSPVVEPPNHVQNEGHVPYDQQINKGSNSAYLIAQPKLTVGSPDDPYEKEAEAVADKVMRMPDQNFIQRKCEGCEEEEKLQRKPLPYSVNSFIQTKNNHSVPTVSDYLSQSIQSSKGKGSSMDPSTTSFMSSHFGTDFSPVKIHTDAEAVQMSRELNAKAFTVGSDVYFNQGQYQPGSEQGKHLLAHELTHTVQQRGIKNHTAQPSIQKDPENQIRRSLALESTVEICHRVLFSRKIKISKGGLRVVLLLDKHDTAIPNCHNHKFWVTLTRSVDWWPDDEIATCNAQTGATRSFSFKNLSSATYYLTIHRSFDNPNCCIKGDILVFDEPVSGDSSGCVRDKDPSAMDIVHGALDLAGFIPVLGAIPDGVNAAIYAIEGDWSNAGFSAVAMVPGWGDGVKLGAMAGKSAIKVSEKAAVKLGEEGIAKGLKEVKAVSKVEKEAAEKTAKEAQEKAAKEAEQKAAKETSEKGKGKKEKGGKYTCFGRSFVLQIPSALPEHKCPDEITKNRIDGPSVSGPSEEAACLAAKHAFNAIMPRGCRPKHLKCVCTKR
ncbi:MAG: DUF4157 domain-containing protein [Anditalea sp.]